MLNWLVNERGIEPHVPVFDKSERTDGTFSRSDFTYDRPADAYICRPARSFGSIIGSSRRRALASTPMASCDTGPTGGTARLVR